MNPKKYFFNKTFLVLIVIFLIALFLRLIYFKDSLTFSIDQARDAFEALSIWTNDPIKIMGPNTDFRGLHHGPAYFYLISPFYFFGNGNMLVVRFVLIVINCLTVFFIYSLTNSLFKNKFAAILSGFLFAISFEATQYARWLSNPAPAIFTLTACFWSLKKIADGKSWALITFAFFWGLSIQFQLFLLYEVIIFPLAWMVLKGKLVFPKFDLKIYLLSFIVFLLTISTYIASEIKFHFQGSKMLAQVFSGQTYFGNDFMAMLITFINSLVNLFFLNIWGINLFLTGIFFILTLLIVYNYLSKNKHKKEILFLLVWLFSPIILELFNKTSAHFTTIGASVAAIILSAFLLVDFIYKKFRKSLFILLIVLVFIGNINLILTKNKDGEVLFKVQDKMLLGDELRVLDWIYKESDGRPFRLNTITVPSYVNATWGLLFSWYGQSKYGYMPYWWGESQDDVPGADVKYSNDKNTKLHFLIIEPQAGNDEVYTKVIKILEDERSNVIKTEKIGSFEVQKREIIRDKPFTHNDVYHRLTHL